MTADTRPLEIAGLEQLFEIADRQERDRNVRRDAIHGRDSSGVYGPPISVLADNDDTSRRGHRGAVARSKRFSLSAQSIALSAIFTIAIVLLIYYHWEQRYSGFALEPVTILIFSVIATFLVLAWTHHDVVPTEAQERTLNSLRVNLVIPVHNEDPVTFCKLLDSIAAQTRHVQRVHIMNDASDLVVSPDGTEYDEIKYAVARWLWASKKPFEVYYERVPKQGKRHVQFIAFDADPEADVFITVDSDTILDPFAVEKGIAPFCKRDVSAVAGLLLSLNYNANLLTRLIDLQFVSSFLIGRASWGRLSSVTVNCGGLAFYRASVVRKWKEEYLTQTVCGKPCTFGDDRMLTTYALMEGRTVFQQGSVGYTLLPENLGHLTRQRIRWWRSWGWGNLWIIRRFSLSRMAWWLTAWQFVDLVLWTVAWPVVFIIDPLMDHRVPWAFFIYVFVLSYVRALRYMTIRHEGRGFCSKAGTVLMAPLSSVLALYVCSVLQYPGIATFTKTGWGTRKTVEVGLNTA